MRSAPGWRVATGLAVVLPAALALVLLGGRSSAQWAPVVDDAAQLAAAATAAASSAWRAHRSRGRGRLSWGLLAAACTSWAAGQGLWTYDQLVQGVAVPFPSWADAGLLGFPALALPALWLRRAAGSGRAGVRSVLDGLMVAASALLISWVSVLQTTWDAGAQSTFALAVSLAYPISDLVMVSVVVLTLGRARARTPLSLLAAGLVAMAVADSAFTYSTAAGSYQSASPTDAGWIAAFLFVACAGLHPQAPEGADARGVRPAETGLAGQAGSSEGRPAPASTRQVVLPHALIAVGACALGVARGCGHRSEAALGIEAVAVAALLLRQLLSTVDNRRLAESTTAQQRQLHRLAFTDELTGLPNRRAVLQELTRALLSDDALGVALVDLDRFKEVNDGLGHAAGDELLRQVAARLLAPGPLRSGLVRSVARLGGDEFLVLVVGPDQHLVAEVSADPRGAAADWGQELLSRFEEPFQLAGARVHVSVSVGLTVRRPVPGAQGGAGGAGGSDEGDGPSGADGGAAHAWRATELLRQVDAAMYEAKARRALGGASAVYDPARHDLATQRLLLVEQLRTAVRGDQLVLHYQPQVDVADGRVSAVEALVRWEHPARGLLGPDAFLGVAESHGLVGELTDVVLAQAVAQLAAWRAAAPPERAAGAAARTAPGASGHRAPEVGAKELRMAVNLSASSLLDDALPGRVAALLHHHGVPARLLVVEVTESVLLTDPERSTAVVAALVDLGVEVSIDDFGTGYSSLTQLQVLPARELKLDRSFTATVLTDPRTAAIVGATIGMAHVLGMRVVAEGVEDEVTLQALAALGCDTTQGYLHARPLPAAAVVGAVDRLHGGAAHVRARAAAT